MRAIAVLLAAIVFAGATLVTSAEATVVDTRAASRAGGGDVGVMASSMTLSPGYQSVAAGARASFTLEWRNYPCCSQSFAVYYEGNGSVFDVYSCWSNCFNGTAGFSYNYSATGTRYPVGADQDGRQSNRVQVDVY